MFLSTGNLRSCVDFVELNDGVNELSENNTHCHDNTVFVVIVCILYCCKQPTVCYQN